MLDSTERDRTGQDLCGGERVSLYPYAQIDGAWNLRDAFVLAVYRQMKAEGTLDVVFANDPVSSEQEFLTIMQNPANLVVFAFDQRDLAAVAWINNIQREHCMAHYWFARSAWGGKALAIGRKILDYWFSFPAADGVLFKAILGVTPEDNRRSRAFNRRLGFTELGVIPTLGQAFSYMENPNG